MQAESKIFIYDPMDLGNKKSIPISNIFKMGSTIPSDFINLEKRAFHYSRPKADWTS
jgi:hypothetical protein